MRGFRYERFHLGDYEGPTTSGLSGRHADEGWKDRRDWLRRQPSPAPEPYRQVAAVFRADGDDRSARKMLMERHSAPVRRDRPAHWRSYDVSWSHRWWRRFLGVSIGHGYEPWRAVWFLVPVIIAMWAWYATAIDDDLLVPTDTGSGAQAAECTDTYPCLEPLVYAIESLVPVVDLGQRSAWMPDASQHGSPFWNDGAWLARATWVTAALGWIFATLIVAGFTSVIRRD